MKVLNKIEADFNDIVANENDIVKDLRIENFSEFKKLGIPTSKEEFWKFTNPSVIKDSEFSLGDSSEITDNEFDIILVNGKLIKKTGKIVNKDIQKSLEEKTIDSNIFEKTDNSFINLNNAFSTEGCVINFGDNSEEQISILNVVDNTSSEQIIHPRVIILAGKDRGKTGKIVKVLPKKIEPKSGDQTSSHSDRCGQPGFSFARKPRKALEGQANGARQARNRWASFCTRS